MIIAVALSGGVDSASAAAILIEQGHDVRAYHMVVGSNAYPETLEHAADIAKILQIPFRSIDLREDFEEEVLSYFLHTYQTGRTPNPCVVCNRSIKFGRLLDRAMSEGAEAFATGHYVRMGIHPRYGRLMQCANDLGKDQTYFLAQLPKRVMKVLCFPNGGFSKASIREKAAAWNLPVHDKPESQELCFFPGDYRAFLNLRGILAQPGPIVDESGRVLGQHQGLCMYTVGQRKGLNISSQEPLYVTEIDVADNQLIVGSFESTHSGAFWIGHLNWMIENQQEPLDLQCKIRSSMRPIGCRIERSQDSDRAIVTLKTPAHAVTPGQLAAFYDGTFLVGSGFILKEKK